MKNWIFKEKLYVFSAFYLSFFSYFLFSGVILAQSIVPAGDGTGTVVNQEGNQITITGGTFSGDGANLFHSLEKLGLSEGQIADFLSNPQVKNILTRVVGGDPSVINGLLQVTGGASNLFIMNPAGVIFGNQARLNVLGDFVVTTATGIGFGDHAWFNAVGSNDYVSLMGNPDRFAFDLAHSGSIVNRGTLNVTEGHNISLIGGNVVNSGVLSAPRGNITITALEGTGLLRISSENGLISLLVEVPRDNNNIAQEIKPTDLATLLTIGGESEAISEDLSNLRGNVLNLGEINTNSLTNGGNIAIAGDNIEIKTGVITAMGVNNGGNIRIRTFLSDNGDFTAKTTYIGETVEINADSQISGQGGNIIIFGDDITRFEGKVTARGGILGGNGGFVEVSGKNQLIAPNLLSNIDISAPRGQGGTLFIDPNNIVIRKGSGSVIDDNGMTNATPLGANDINSFLNHKGNLTIETSGNSGEVGNILQEVGANINWNSNYNLTLTADNNIELKGGINATGLGLLTLNAGGDITLNSLLRTHNKVTLNSQGLTSINFPMFLGSLETDELGSTQINANIFTNGSQLYQDSVVIGNSVSLVLFNNLEGDTPQSIVFKNQVNSLPNTHNNLLIIAASETENINQNIIFEKEVGNIDSLGDLLVVANNDITFQGNINNNGEVSVATFQKTTFNGDVTAKSLLTDDFNISDNSNNQTIINGNITVTERQNYNDRVIINGNSRLTGDSIHFQEKVTGGGSLTLQPFTDTLPIHINIDSSINDPSQFVLTTTDIKNLQGVNGLTIGGSHLQNIIHIDGDTIFNNARVTLQGNNITQAGSLRVNNTLSLNVNENITLNNSNNDFNRVTIVDSSNVTLNDINNINIQPTQIIGDLQISSLGITRLTGNISANRLTINNTDTGKTEINGNITTHNEQTYQNPVTLTNATILNGSSLNLNKPLTGNNQNLTLNFDNPVTLSDANFNNINNLIITQKSFINGNFTTLGSQTYNDTVTLTNATILNGSSLNLNKPLTGNSQNLTLNFSNPVTLSDANFNNINNLIVTQKSFINGNFTTLGSQTYNDTVTLANSSVLNSNNSPILFNSNITSAAGKLNDLTLTTGLENAQIRGNIDGIGQFFVFSNNINVQNINANLVNLNAINQVNTNNLNAQTVNINSQNGIIKIGNIDNNNSLNIFGKNGIEIDSINAQGNINLNSDHFVRIRQGFILPSNLPASIFTLGNANIIIIHGEPIFEVGSNQFNYSGTAFNITNQQNLIPTGTTLTNTTILGNIAVIFTNPSSIPPIINPPIVPDPDPIPPIINPPIVPDPDPIPPIITPPIVPDPDPLLPELLTENRLVNVSNPVNINNFQNSTETFTEGLQNSEQTSYLTSYSLSSFYQLENEVTQEFEDYLGITAAKDITIEEIQKLLQIRNQETNTKTAIIYALFQPSQSATSWNFDSSENKAKTSNKTKDDQLVLTLVTAEGLIIRKTIKNVTRQDIINTMKDLQLTILNPRRPDAFLTPSQQLYQWLIQPLKPELESQNIDNLAFILDSGLRSLPLAALHDGESFLIENYSISMLPSLSLTDFRYNNLQGKPVLAMGASEFKQQNLLPAVPIELSIITENIAQSENFLNENFTLNNLQTARQNTPFQIIHLATHAKFNEGQLSNSYIQLWNEKLTINQLKELNLDTPSVDLLVLSACQTALGDKNAELGFAGTAILAKVKTVLGSLWEVSDEGTLGLMTIFYQSLQTSPTKAQALRQAQLSLLNGEVRLENGKLVIEDQRFDLPPTFAEISNQKLNHPYYWAAFTLIGSPW